MKIYRYQITFIDEFGDLKRYMNGASFESLEAVNYEIELLKKDSIKFNKGRTDFKSKKVELKK